VATVENTGWKEHMSIKLQELLANVREQGSTVTIDREIVGDDLPNLWRPLLKSGGLTINDASVSSHRGSFTIQGQLKLFSLDPVEAEVTFFNTMDAKGETRVECVVQTKSDSWRLADDFDALPQFRDFSGSTTDLQNSFLTEFVFLTPAFAFSSFDFSDGSTGITNSFSGNAEVNGQPLCRGLTFASTVDASDSAWDTVRLVIPGLPATLRLLGTIEVLEDAELLLLLRADLSGLTFSIGAGPTVDINAVVIQSGLQSDSRFRPTFLIETELTYAKGTLLLILATNIGAGRMVMRGEFGEGHVFALADLSNLLGIDLKGLEDAMPENSGASYFGNVGLRELKLDLSVSPFHVEEISFAVTTQNPWTAFNGKIQITPVMCFTTSRPGETDSQTRLEMFGQWQLGGTRFETYLSTDGSFQAQMPAGETLDTTEVFNQMLPGLDERSVRLTEMRFAGNYRSQEFTLRLDAADVLSFELGTTKFDVQWISFFANHDGKNTSWEFEGSMQLGELELTVCAEHRGVDSWLISGQLVVVEPLSVRQMLRTLLDQFHPGDHHRFPDSIPADYADVALRKFSIEYDSDDKSLTLELDVDLTIALTDHFEFKQLAVHLELDENGLSNARVAAKLEIASVSLALTMEKTEDCGLVFSGQTEPGNVPKFDELLSDLADKFGVSTEMPTLLQQLDLEQLELRYEQDSGNLMFRCRADLPEADAKLDLEIHLEHKQTEGKSIYRRLLAGRIELGGKTFDLALGKDDNSQTLLAHYAADPPTTIALHDLGAALSSDFAKVIPTSLNISVSDVLLAWLKPENADSIYIIGVDIEAGVNLAELPLVGNALTSAKSLRLGFQPLAVSADVSADLVAAMQALAADNSLTLPKDELKKGVHVEAKLQLGETSIRLDLPVEIDNKGDLQHDPSKDSASAGTKWFALQKSFGPVHFERVGLEYDSGEIWVLLDGALTAGGVTLKLIGLGVGTNLSDLTPKFSLHGIEVESRSGDLEIGGGLLREQVVVAGKKTDQYNGEIVIRTDQLSIHAIGSYAEYAGHPSLFVYAVLDYPLGGPGFFFVTGLALGYGYNRRLVLPAVDQLQSFPLIQEATQAVAPAGSVSDALQRLANDIVPSVGDQFFAVGVKFSSFKMIDSFALLVVRLGDPFEIDVLGQSVAVIPTPEAGKPVSPMAEIHINWMARFVPEDGFLGVDARLTPASYVLSRNCHLTGGFAFYSWFKGPHSGDFVACLGGYHPGFKPPAHYPQVPRLKFNWIVDANLTIKGDAYFALTSTAVMTGGHLEATWEKGALKAWFKVGADFLMAWKPYHYEASMYIDIGGSYTYHFFGTHHLTIDVGADLHIWGPDFSGTATIHLWIVSKTVEFGSHARTTPKPIDWRTFKDSFLPDDDEICTVSVKSGLVSTRTIGGEEIWVINPSEFCLVTDSRIPSNRAAISKDETVNGAVSVGIASLAIGSMAVAESDLKSTHEIVLRDAAGKPVDEFAFQPLRRAVPVALWGPRLLPSLDDHDMIQNALSGFEVRPKSPPRASATEDIKREDLRFATEVMPPTSERDSWGWAEVSARIEGRLSVLFTLGGDKPRKVQRQVLEMLDIPIRPTDGFQPGYSNSLLEDPFAYVVPLQSVS
jgi:hypothetical protein